MAAWRAALDELENAMAGFRGTTVVVLRDDITFTEAVHRLKRLARGQKNEMLSVEYEFSLYPPMCGHISEIGTGRPQVEWQVYVNEKLFQHATLRGAVEMAEAEFGMSPVYPPDIRHQVVGAETAPADDEQKCRQEYEAALRKLPAPEPPSLGTTAPASGTRAALGAVVIDGMDEQAQGDLARPDRFEAR